MIVKPDQNVWYQDEIISKCQLYTDWQNGEWAPGTPSPISEAEIERCENVDRLINEFPTISQDIWHCLFYEYSADDPGHDVSKILTALHHASPIKRQAIEAWIREMCNNASDIPVDEYIWRYEIVHKKLLPYFKWTKEEAESVIKDIDKIIEYETIMEIEQHPEIFDGVTVSPEQQGPSPSVSATTSICSQMFDFRFTSSTNVRQAAGLRNLSVTLPVSGANKTYTFPRIYFESENLAGGCSESLNQKAAIAINQAVVSTTQRIVQGTLVPGTTPTSTLDERVRSTYFIELRRNFRREVDECAADRSSIPIDVKLIGINAMDEMVQLQNTLFRDFSTDFATRCP